MREAAIDLSSLVRASEHVVEFVVVELVVSKLPMHLSVRARFCAGNDASSPLLDDDDDDDDVVAEDFDDSPLMGVLVSPF